MHLEDFEDSVKIAQGNWASRPGMKSYVHGSLQHANKVTSAIHNLQMCPVVQLRTLLLHAYPRLHLTHHSTKQLPSWVSR